MAPKKKVLLYQKKIDWSLFKDGFALPMEIQSRMREILGLELAEGTKSGIVLVIDGKACEAELRRLPISESHPDHAPIVQIRYKASSDAAERFREIFSEEYAYLCTQKKMAASRKRLKLDGNAGVYVYATEDLDVFIVECYRHEPFFGLPME